MPRVHKQKKSGRGKERKCGRCGVVIKPGDMYFHWSFRYGGTQFRCAEHYPRQSELTQSKMADVYAAIEEAQDALQDATEVSEVIELVHAVGERAQEVAEEYREAAESFGGMGENAERADELESFADELSSFDAEEEPDNEDVRAKVEAQMTADGFSEEDEAEWTSVFEARMEEAADGDEDPAAEALEAARNEAQDVLNGCPL